MVWLKFIVPLTVEYMEETDMAEIRCPSVRVYPLVSI